MTWCLNLSGIKTHPKAFLAAQHAGILEWAPELDWKAFVYYMLELKFVLQDRSVYMVWQKIYNVFLFNTHIPFHCQCTEAWKKKWSNMYFKFSSIPDKMMTWHLKFHNKMKFHDLHVVQTCCFLFILIWCYTKQTVSQPTLDHLSVWIKYKVLALWTIIFDCLSWNTICKCAIGKLQVLCSLTTVHQIPVDNSRCTVMLLCVAYLSCHYLF